MNGIGKGAIAAGIFCLGGFISTALGGWNTALQTLCVLMGLDYVMGLIVAGVFKRSKKSEDGRLESRAGWKGLVRKGVQLALVLVGAQLDSFLGVSFVRDGIITAFCLNEVLSIVENAGLMGIPLPPALVRAVEVLKMQSGDGSGKTDSGSGKADSGTPEPWTDTDSHFPARTLEVDLEAGDRPADGDREAE